MPAITLVIHERKGTLAARVIPLVQALPVRVRETRSQPAFRAALAELPFAVVFLEPDLEPALTADFLRAAWAARAATIVFARPRSWAEQFEFRELGARAVLDPRIDGRELALLCARLIEQAGERLRATG